MKNKFFRTLAVTLAAVLCFTAFSTTAFAGGADPDPAPLPEETGTPTTGGIELDTEDAEGGSNTSGTTEDTESTDTGGKHRRGGNHDRRRNGRPAFFPAGIAGGCHCHRRGHPAFQ